MSNEFRHLSRRERQIMDVLYRTGKATALEVMQDIPDSPGYSAVRTLLTVLERKGHVRHERNGHHYTYFPVTPKGEARTTALAHVMETFFQGSPTEVMSALIDVSRDRLTSEDYTEILQLLEKSREDGR